MDFKTMLRISIQSTLDIIAIIINSVKFRIRYTPT